MSAFEIAYCLPAGDAHVAYAFKFLNSYLTFPPMIECDLVILTDPGNEQEAVDIFSMIPNVRAVATPDHAKDLSRYEAYVKQSGAACLMMLGGSAYCRRAGWALRAYRAFQTLGSNAIFGACGHAGAPGVHKHIRTTGWWAAPALLNRYPHWPKNEAGRYEMEHGTTCISGWVLAQGGQCWVVNMGSEFTLENPQGDVNGYARGNHSSLLIGDRLCAPPYMPFA
jgi:hypothetical protein